MENLKNRVTCDDIADFYRHEGRREKAKRRLLLWLGIAFIAAAGFLLGWFSR